MKFFTTTKLSAHQDLTPEGFLLARDIRIARCGTQYYRDVELPDVIANGDGWISVDRDPTEVFNEDSIASFTGKPITNDHPYTVVTPDNWQHLAIGTVQNVRKGTGDDHDCLVADLLFTTQRGIDLIRSGKRALSVGYDAVYEQTQPGRARQRQIVANHVALVDEGRCGPRCTIVDGAPWYAVDYADPPSLPRRGPPVRQYLGAAPPALVVFGVRRQVGDFADIDYPWTRDLEAWVNEPRDPEGQWTTGGGSHAPQENAREPVIGKPITVMRVGSEKGGLGGRDAGNLASVANHYVRLSDFETPSSRGGSPTHMSIYQITLPPQLGEYQRFNAHSGGGTGDLVGRAAGKRGDGFHIVYSFPKTYKDEKRTLSIPLTEVDAELKKMGYNNADEAGGNETAKAMQAVIDRHTVKVAEGGTAKAATHAPVMGSPPPDREGTKAYRDWVAQGMANEAARNPLAHVEDRLYPLRVAGAKVAERYANTPQENASGLMAEAILSAWTMTTNGMHAISVGANGKPDAAAFLAARGWREGKATEGELMYVGSMAKGKGRAVVMNVLRQAKEAGIKKITATAFNEALGFYRKLGFKEIDPPDPENDTTHIEMVLANHNLGKIGDAAPDVGDDECWLVATKEWLAGPRKRTADDWNESEHPRGQPENKGEFATAPGGGSSKAKGHGIPGLPEGRLSSALRKFAQRGGYVMTAAKGDYGKGRYDVTVTAKPIPGIVTIGTGRHTYQYDPAYAHVETLNPEEPIIARDIVVPNEGVPTRLPLERDPTKMYRGMSSEEYENYLKTGEFKSKSEYNMEGQEALTYWSTDPDQAESYANSFAPAQFKATFEKPAYVVVAHKAAPEDLVKIRGTGENELGVNRAVKQDEVTEVWRGRVVVLEAGDYSVSDRGDDTFEDGSSSPPSTDVVWEKVEPGDADAGGGVSFVSPSVADHLDFAQAVAGLKSKRQQILQAASQDIDRSLGLRSTDMGAVGAWSDGAENSIMTTIHGGTFEELMVAAAMKASIAEQKAALVFKDDPAGTSWLFSFPAKGDLNEIHKNLLADGVAFHTIIPTSGGATVYVVDMEGDTKHAVAQAAQRYGATVDTERGHSEFIGTQKQDGTDAEQRADAVAEYGRRIAGSGVPGAQALWERIHSAYGSKLHLEHDHWHADIDYGWSEDVEWRDDYDPNEPRVTSGPTAGEWTAGGGGAPSSTKSVLPNVKSKTAREVKAEAAKAVKAAQAMATRAQNVARIKAMPAKEPDAISTRLISEPQRRETGNDPHTHAQDLVDWATATRPDAAEWLKKATDLLVGNKLYPPGKDKTGKAKIPDEYVGMPPGPAGETPAQAAERFIDFAKDNILAIYHAVPKSWRHDASKWYDGANVIAHDWAKEYKYSAPQIAGVMASLSPKKDWFMNVDLAKRILDYTRDYKDVQFTDNSAKQLQAMIDKKKTKKQQADKVLLQKILHNLKRPDGAWKTLGEVTDPVERAAWMNMYDLAETKDPNFKALTPGGKFLDYVTNKGEEAEEDDDEDGEEAAPAALGARTTRTWQVLKNTAKAIRILQDGSTENISRNLGEAHKVRNFYMNILHPNSPNGHVTIDTHAIAAAFLRPFGQKDEEVLVGLGNASPSNSVLGLGGTYPIIAEAYRRAAAQASEEEPGLTILPRQMQSITWEGGRGLFSPEFKRDKVKRAAVTDIWRQVSQKKITAAAARKKIMLLASPELKGVPRSPDWVGK